MKAVRPVRRTHHAAKMPETIVSSWIQSNTFQLQLALKLSVDLLLVELGVGALEVKVFLKLHGSVSANVEASSAAVSASSPAPVSRCASSHCSTE